MVDIIRCERCGKVIPALETGCPYCEEPDRGLGEPHYLPLAIRLLLGLFAVNVTVTMVLAVATLLNNFGGSLRDSVLTLLATLRFLTAAGSLLALVLREPWGRHVPLVFVGFEALTGIAITMGWLPDARWAGGMLAPLWNVLFLFLFLREDVQVRFDPGILDRRAVGELLSQVGRPESKRRRRFPGRG
ncbi:MAG TPA: hypothetical protein VKA86_02240 [Candidatus Krumholzibacteria bacterium]|nr:hypothetical protein [Candidatus Krumholzibacteria bacterium]